MANSVIDWLKEKGTAAIDVMKSPAVNVIQDFSRNADLLEREYLKWLKLRAVYQGIGSPFPRTDIISQLSAEVTRNRSYKIALLKAMNAVGANPGEYGLSIYGLSKTEIESAYPGLKYNATEARLGALPVLAVSAALLAALAVAAVTTSALYKQAAAFNFADDLTKELIAQGYPPEEAARRASVAIGAVNSASGKSVVTDIAGLIKWLVIGAVAYMIFSRMMK